MIHSEACLACFSTCAVTGWLYVKHDVECVEFAKHARRESRARTKDGVTVNVSKITLEPNNGVVPDDSCNTHARILD